MRRKFLIILLSLVVSCLVAACLSPTLPLPPPTEPSQTQGADAEHVHMKSVKGALPNATITIRNQRLAQSDSEVDRGHAIGGAVADDAGTWETEIWAHDGDGIFLEQDNGLGSASITFVVNLP